MEAPPPAVPNAGPDALVQEIERLSERVDELESELRAERERRAALDAAHDRQRAEATRFRSEAARLRAQLHQGTHELPAPAWADRPVNPSLRTKWRWITRALVVLVFLVVLGAVYLLVHAYIDHESIGHVWAGVRNFF
jgi:hypothetical protein